MAPGQAVGTDLHGSFSILIYAITDLGVSNIWGDGIERPFSYYAASMRNEVKTQGIIVHGHSYGEGDRILILFTQELGLVRVIAKAARHPSSRWGARCEPLILSELHLASRSKTQDLLRLIASQPIEFWPQVRSDLRKLSVAYYLLDLALSLLPEREPQKKHFIMTVKALRALEAGEDPKLVRLAYEHKSLAMAGFAPELDHCVACQKELRAGMFSSLSGGLHCPDCAGGRAMVSLSSTQVELLKNLRTQGLKTLRETPLPSPLMNSLQKVTESYIDAVLEKPLKSRPFLGHIEDMYNKTSVSIAGK